MKLLLFSTTLLILASYQCLQPKSRRQEYVEKMEAIVKAQKEQTETKRPPLPRFKSLDYFLRFSPRESAESIKVGPRGEIKLPPLPRTRPCDS